MGTAVLRAAPSRPPAAPGAVPVSPTAAPAGDRAGQQPATPGRFRWWRSGWLRLALACGGLVAAVLCLRGRLPAWPAVWAVLGHADGRWLAAAVLLHVASMVAFGEQQRHLLGAFKVRMPVGAAVALTYIRSAMSISLPAGSAVSAGYAYRRFKAYGAGDEVAGVVMVLSGVASTAGLALLYGADVEAWAGGGSGRWWVLLGVTLLAGMLLGVRRLGPRRSGTPVGSSRWVGGRLAGWTAVVLRAVRLTGRVTAGQWVVVGGLAVLNWLTDVVCLVAVVRGVGLHTPVLAVATAYLVVQVVRQVPVTPGGVGVIEASLLIGLTSAGAAQVPAAAAVLIYRVVSCWAILPVGALCWLAQTLPVRDPAETAMSRVRHLAHR